MNWRHLGPAKIHDNGRHFYVFSDFSYQELLVCYIQIFYIILKLNFVWVSASELDETLVNNWCASSPKCWKIDEIFKKYENFNFSKQNLFFLENFKILKNNEFSKHMKNSTCQSQTFLFKKKIKIFKNDEIFKKIWKV